MGTFADTKNILFLLHNNLTLLFNDSFCAVEYAMYKFIQFNTTLNITVGTFSAVHKVFYLYDPYICL